MNTPRIQVSTVIEAPPAEVWADLRNIASHTAWMEDAVAIRFTTEASEGVGAAFDCDTRVGPFHLTDKMVVTAWVPERSLGIRHNGVVTGSGQFTLEPDGPERTRFTWSERLTFPWWLGGPIGGVVGGQILRVVWRRNLANLSSRF